MGSQGNKSSSAEVFGIQYLRGLAAILVVIHHSFANRFDYLLGGFGVEIFFVISGFIMWYTTTSMPISMVDFWQRRVIRIVPLYWCFLLLMIIVASVAPRARNSTIITSTNTVKSFLFIPHFHEVQHIIAPILIPGWSLNYEMFFYFIFGLTLLIASMQLRACLIGAILIGLVVIGVIFKPTGAIAETYTNLILLDFLSGIMLAITYEARKLKGVALGLILMFAGLLSRPLEIVTGAGILYPLGFLAPTLVVAGTLAVEMNIRAVPSVILLTIGNASYSIYLSHLFIIRLGELGWSHLMRSNFNLLQHVAYVSYLVGSAIVGGIIVYYVVERPILRMLKGYLFATAGVAFNREWRNAADRREIHS